MPMDDYEPFTEETPINHIPHTQVSSQFTTVIDTFVEDDYKELMGILDEAFDFCARGKGAERHGFGKPWRDQHHWEIAQHYGQGFALGQAEKKARESVGLQWPAARRELLGAIGYLASAIYAGDRGVD